MRERSPLRLRQGLHIVGLRNLSAATCHLRVTRGDEVNVVNHVVSINLTFANSNFQFTPLGQQCLLHGFHYNIVLISMMVGDSGSFPVLRLSRPSGGLLSREIARRSATVLSLSYPSILA